MSFLIQMHYHTIIGGSCALIFESIFGKWPIVNFKHTFICSVSFKVWLRKQKKKKKKHEHFSSSSKTIKTKIKLLSNSSHHSLRKSSWNQSGKKIQKFFLKFKQLFPSKLLSGWREKKIFQKYIMSKQCRTRRKKFRKNVHVYDSSIFRKCLFLFFLFPFIQGCV